MSSEKGGAWAGDPNSANQRWSRWTFKIDSPRRVAKADVVYNVAAWLRMLFRTDAARARADRKPLGVGDRWVILCEVEGVAVHDPGVVENVREQFRIFVSKGFGPLAACSVEAKLLAGDAEAGDPAEQLVVMPAIHRGG